MRKFRDGDGDDEDDGYDQSQRYRQGQGLETAIFSGGAVQFEKGQLEEVIESNQEIITARSGVDGINDAISRYAPEELADMTYEEVIQYLTGDAEDEGEEEVEQSILEMLPSNDLTILANGRPVNLNDRVGDSLITKVDATKHGQGYSYRALDIEVTTVVEGGDYHIFSYSQC